MTPPEDDPQTRDALYTDGLLSPVLDAWRLEYLKQHADWFEPSRLTNQLALRLWLKYWRTTEGQKLNATLPTAARIYGRAINNFAGAVVLCERGSAIEAASLARAVTESSFWLSYMANQSVDAMHDLDVDDLSNTIARLKELQRVSPNDPATLAFANAEIPKLVTKLGGRKAKRKMDVFAKEFGEDTSYLRFRLLSGIYSHVSSTSLTHHVLITGDDTAFNTLGPHSSEIPHVLYFATSALIDCGAAYSALTNDQPIADELRAASGKVLALRDTIPPRKLPGEP